VQPGKPGKGVNLFVALFLLAVVIVAAIKVWSKWKQWW
jgi:hypothetical protein